MTEEADEVKVFRVKDEDESDGPSLADDKKDVAMEEEMESKPFFNGKSAFQPAMPASPSFGSLFPYSPAGVMNPFQMALMNQAAAATITANAYLQALSPCFTSLPMAPSSPMQDMYNRAAALVAAVSPMAGPRVGMMSSMMPMPGMGMAGGYRPNPLAQMMGAYGMGGGGGMAASTSVSAPATPVSVKRKREKVEKGEDHIKKPKNAYFWFMEENRKVLMNEDEWKDKQSADLNKELGKRWHDMGEEEKKPYFAMAAKDKEEHSKKYPNWSARENYANSIKKKKKKERTAEPGDGKKCRARFGMTAQDKWCKHCMRKKKCLYTGGVEDDERTSTHSANHRATDSESDLDDDDTAGVTDADLKVKMELTTPMILTPSFALNSLLLR